MNFYSRNRNRGFTLVELLVVIAIITILTALVLASLSTVRRMSRDGRRIADIKQIQIGLAQFYEACRQYPTSLSASASNNCPSGVSLGTFISPIPVPPKGASRSTYYYKRNSAYSYCLGASLEDGSHREAQQVDGCTDPGNVHFMVKAQ